MDKYRRYGMNDGNDCISLDTPQNEMTVILCHGQWRIVLQHYEPLSKNHDLMHILYGHMPYYVVCNRREFLEGVHCWNPLWFYTSRYAAAVVNWVPKWTNCCSSLSFLMICPLDNNELMVLYVSVVPLIAYCIDLAGFISIMVRNLTLWFGEKGHRNLFSSHLIRILGAFSSHFCISEVLNLLFLQTFEACLWSSLNISMHDYKWHPSSRILHCPPHYTAGLA